MQPTPNSFRKRQDLFKESIGNNRFLTASIYRDELFVHIREYDNGHGQSYPTRKGVSFTKPRWANFVRQINEIDRSVELLKTNQPVDYRHHLGGKYHVSVSKGMQCVNIRRYFRPKNSTKEIPTRSGIALRLDEWEALTNQIEQLHEKLPELKYASPCYDDHLNQMGYFSCRECNPYDFELSMNL